MLSKLFFSIILSIIALSTTAQQKISKDSIYAVVDEIPLFPGGEPGLAKYLSKNIRYSQHLNDEGIFSGVSVQFIIDTLGCVTAVKPMKGSGSGALTNELIRIAKMMPAWKPAMYQGKKVATLYCLPIGCILPQE